MIPIAEPDFDMTLPHIVLHSHSQHCLACNRDHSWSAVFECTTKGRTKQYRPSPSLVGIPSDYRLVPVQLPTEYVPICHSCLTEAAPAMPDYEAHRRWQATLMRKSIESNGIDAPKAPKVVPTVDML